MVHPGPAVHQWILGPNRASPDHASSIFSAPSRSRRTHSTPNSDQTGLFIRWLKGSGGLSTATQGHQETPRLGQVDHYLDQDRTSLLRSSQGRRKTDLRRSSPTATNSHPAEKLPTEANETVRICSRFRYSTVWGREQERTQGGEEERSLRACGGERLPHPNGGRRPD